MDYSLKTGRPLVIRKRAIRLDRWFSCFVTVDGLALFFLPARPFKLWLFLASVPLLAAGCFLTRGACCPHCRYGRFGLFCWRGADLRGETLVCPGCGTRLLLR